jgi:signal transduction histidine kinase/ABC-type amino acid transport substrate-binding protein
MKTRSNMLPDFRLRQYLLISFCLFVSIFFFIPYPVGAGRVSANNVFKIGVNKDFSPFEFTNKAGVPTGYTVELMSAVAARMGLRIEFVPDIWSNTIQALNSGDIDAVTGMMYSEQRDEIFDFSIPTIIISYALFKRNETSINSLSDVMNKDYEIIIVENVFAYEWLKQNKITNSVITVKTPAEALLLLASGKHDCVIMPRLHGLNLLENLGIDKKIETVGPPVLGQKFCFAVAAGNSDLLAELNEGIYSLQQSGEYDEIYLKWFSVDKHNKQDRKYLQFLIACISLIIFLLLAVLFWNWLLKRAVHSKTRDLRQTHARLKQIIDGVPIATFVIDKDRLVTHWNRACELLTDTKAEMIIATRNYPEALYDDQQYSTVDLLMDNVLTKRSQRYENSLYRQSALLDGAYETVIYRSSSGDGGRWYYCSAVLLRDEAGGITGGIETWQDLTEFKQLERQLVQSQKMEAIGTLAGGIAHDFSNILTAVIGNAELAVGKIPVESSARGNLEQVLAAALRARNLTKQILAFGRHAEIKPKPVQLHAVVKEALALVASSLPSNITVELDLRCNTAIIADETHILQVVMNLCTNAIQAMSKTGGVLEIILSEVEISKDDLAPETELKPGKCILLSVKDNGEGISQDISSQIFNPFFTTKARGEGTGMGLSVTHGIVKQYGGALVFNSQVGNGSIFHVYFPICED